MSKELKFNILVKENFDKALSFGERRLKGFMRFSGGIARGIRATFKGLLDFRTIMAGGGLLGGVAFSVKKAFDVETVQTQLKVALGNAKEAKKIYREMVDFSDSTNFEADEVTKLGTSLIATGSAAAGVIDEIRMLGDIAAGTSTPLSELGNILIKIRGKGKLQGDTMDMFMERGIPIVKALAGEMGVAESEIADLVSSGQVGFPLVVKALKAMTGEGGQFHRMMEELSTTGNGLISTLKGKWSSALAEFGAHFSDLSKGAIQGLIERLDKLRNDGTIEKWAERGAKSARVLANVLGDIFSGDQQERAKALGDIKEGITIIFQDAATVFLNTLAPGLYDLFSNIPGLKQVKAKSEQLGTSQGVIDSMKAEENDPRLALLFRDMTGMVLNQKQFDQVAEYDRRVTEDLNDFRKDGGAAGEMRRSKSDLQFDDWLKKMTEDHSGPELTPGEVMGRQIGEKLAVWMKDPSLMIREGMEATGLSGFAAKGKSNPAAVEGKAVGGEQLSLSDIFTRLQDRSPNKEEKMGTKSNPMYVMAPQLESTEGGQA